MNRSWLSLFAALVLTLSGAARAQETFSDLRGTWWFEIGGKDRGALLIAFSAPDAGIFFVEEPEVTELPSFGFSRVLGAFFDVTDGQPLALDSKGNIVGSVALTDPDTGEALGTLRFAKGKPNKKYTRWSIRGTVVGDDGIPVSVKLTGKRAPEEFPVLTGRDHALDLYGKGVKSDVFDLEVTSAATLGLPAYDFLGSGPARIDKVEVPDTSMAGRFILSPKFALFGLLEESSDLGTGNVSGKLRISDTPVGSTIPRINMLAVADRKVRLKGSLTEPVDAVLQVTPASFNFGALALDDTEDEQFDVSNVGAADSTVSGSASFLAGSSTDFSFVGAVTYGPLEPGDTAVPITVRFAPNSAGTKTAQVRFSVDGGPGAKVVELTGVGGIAVINVDPDSLDFVDTTIGGSVFKTVTVTNDGDGTLSGSATISEGEADFALTRNSSREPVSEITYNLDADESASFSVRFNPSTTGVRPGTVTLTGGGGATVDLSGTGLR